MKNASMVSTLGLIMWLGETHVGKIHDKPMVEFLYFLIPITMLTYLGFKGWTSQNIPLILPHKNPPNTKTEKRLDPRTERF